MLRALLGREIDLRMELHCPADTLRADPVQLEQSILNLGLNARDALADTGGTLTIRTRRALAADLADGSLPFGHAYAVLEIADDGPGMSEEVRARALEPFYTTKGPDSGSGLGLSSVYGVVRQLGGRMDLDSAPDRGCRVCMVLPLETAAKPVAPARAERPLDSYRILVVDDEPLVLAVVQRILKRAGFSPIAYSEPQEAIAVARDDDDGFDLLITDVVMPGTSGVEVYKAVRERHPDQRVIFISGYSDGRLNELRALPGEYAFVEKPFDRVGLIDVVRDVLGVAASAEARTG